MIDRRLGYMLATAAVGGAAVVLGIMSREAPRANHSTNNSKPDITDPTARIVPASPEERRLQRLLDDSLALRPDCAAYDVDTELMSLARGVDTVPKGSQEFDSETVSYVRLVGIEMLQDAARRIMQTPNRDTRAERLAKEYYYLSTGIHSLAMETSPRTRLSLTEIAACYTVKGVTLTIPPRIEAERRRRMH